VCRGGLLHWAQKPGMRAAVFLPAIVQCMGPFMTGAAESMPADGGKSGPGFYRQSEGLDAHFDNRVLMFPSVIAIVVALTIFSVKNGLLEKGSQRPRNDSVIW